MKAIIELECNCGNKESFSISDKHSLYLSDEIEKGTENSFYCNVNYTNGMVINCTKCGEEKRWFI